MSYVGNSPNYQSFAVDTFAGGSANYTLTYTPGSAAALLIFVDGVYQVPTTDFTVSGTTLTPTTVWLSGTSIVVTYLGRMATIGVPSDGTISGAKIVTGAVTYDKNTYLTGQVIQSVYAEYLTNADLSTSIPVDDTIPQITEGVEIITATITPKYATSKIRCRFLGEGSNSIADVHCVVALFRDAVANALAGQTTTIDKANYAFGFMLEFQETAPSTSAITYRIRAGRDTAGTGVMRFNGNTTTRWLGGVARSTLVVEEVAV